MCQQLSIFPAGMKPGEYVERAGERLTWGELAIGMRVVYDCSTEHRTPQDKKSAARCKRTAERRQI